jgi:periplasmic copper chaperone A
MNVMSYKILIVSLTALVGLNSMACEQMTHDYSSDNHQKMMNENYEDTAELQAMHEHHMASNNHVMIDHGWLRATAPSQKVSAAFMTIVNHNKHDIELVGARAAFANTVEIHLSSMTDGIMKMEKQMGLTIKAGQSGVLKPGSFHLMVMGLQQSLNEGDQQAITLIFADGLEIEVNLKIQMNATMHDEKSSNKHGMMHSM